MWLPIHPQNIPWEKVRSCGSVSETMNFMLRTEQKSFKLRKLVFQNSDMLIIPLGSFQSSVLTAASFYASCFYFVKKEISK